MATKRININAENHAAAIEEASHILQQGGLVAFPTETVYGLGANALDEKAVAKVFEAKGRPSDNPLIVHVAAIDMVTQFVLEIPDKGVTLAREFWPGPLTLVLKRRQNVPNLVTAGLETVAMRVPNHPVTLELLKKFNGGIVGPSANTSGKPSPTTADHVYHDLHEKIEMILDAGPTVIGVESTVIDVTVDPPVILRIGGLSREKIEATIGEIHWTNSEDLLKRSPGTRHRHYAPNARVVLFRKEDTGAFNALIHREKKSKNKIGAITYSKNLREIEATSTHITLESSVEYFARNLFRAIRELDRMEVDVMLIESVDETGLGAAVMDRLRKAAYHSN